MRCLTTCVLISLVASNLASVLVQNPKLTNMGDGFLELKANGSLILRDNTLSNYSNVWQEAVIFKTILNALRLMPLKTKSVIKDLNHKIYGEGVEHKFPPFLERVIQRIQTYFSIYKYTDTSQPVRQDKKSTSTTPPSSTATATSTTLSGILNETLTLGQNEIDFNLTSSNSGFNKNNNTLLNADNFKKPFKITTSTTPTKPTVVVYDEDEENEFIEIKNGKRV